MILCGKLEKRIQWKKQTISDPSDIEFESLVCVAFCLTDSSWFCRIFSHALSSSSSRFKEDSDSDSDPDQDKDAKSSRMGLKMRSQITRDERQEK